MITQLKEAQLGVKYTYNEIAGSNTGSLFSWWIATKYMGASSISPEPSIISFLPDRAENATAKR